MEERLNQIEKEIEEKEQDLAMKYYEGYTDNSQEIQEIISERDELYKRRQEMLEQQSKEIEKQIEEKELDLAIKYNEGYTDDSKEVQDIKKELEKLYKKRQEILEPKKETKKDNTQKEDKKEEPEPQENSEEQSKNEPEEVVTEGIAKEDIRARIADYEQKQREMWADGPDMASDKDKREFERRNNVISGLKELLNKNPNSEFVSMEDINGMIYDTKQQINDLWAQVMNSGEGATPQEQALLTKLNDVVKELEGISKLQTKQEASKDDNSNENSTPAGKDGSGYAEGGFQPPAVVDPEKEFQPPAVVEPKKDFQPPVLKFPMLDLEINKKTGEVLLIENGDRKNAEKTYMNADNYKKEKLEAMYMQIRSKQNVG